MIECTFFGHEARFHHVGLAIRSIRDADPSFPSYRDENLGVAMAFLDLGGVTIELLEPIGEDSPIAKNLRDGVKLVHLCYEVPDLEEALEEGRRAGFRRISKIEKQPVYDDRRVVWVFNKHYGVIELLERPPDATSEG